MTLPPTTRNEFDVADAPVSRSLIVTVCVPGARFPGWENVIEEVLSTVAEAGTGMGVAVAASAYCSCSCHMPGVRTYVAVTWNGTPAVWVGIVVMVIVAVGDGTVKRHLANISVPLNSEKNQSHLSTSLDS